MRTALSMGRRLFVQLAGYSAAAAAISAAGAGCLDYPVVPSTPTVTGRFEQNIRQDRVDKIDLLFVIDNSASMRDKQEILAEAVPDLVERLVHPYCVTADGSTSTSSKNGKCPDGTALDFEPINDIHIGIIDSSLGAYGAEKYEVCQSTEGSFNNDQAHLLTRGASNLGDTSFLAWDGGKSLSAEDLTNTFKNMVVGVGQTGCGYEAQLEAAYRFLIDPEPTASVDIQENDKGVEVPAPKGIDKTVLDQRAAFLRPDSMVAVIVLSDENEGSVNEDQGFYLLRPKGARDGRPYLPRGTSACQENVNDRCCFSCLEEAREGCTSPKDDPECKREYGLDEVKTNLRLFAPKAQFGIDLLYPVGRWIDGFKETTVKTRDGRVVQNPLYSDLQCKDGKNCMPPRMQSLVFVAGIVGVPWKDIAKDPSDLGKGFLSADELTAKGVWDLILGDPQASPPVAPTDPFMVESVKPRVDLKPHPSTNESPRPTSAGPNANSTNSHEWEAAESRNGDLQYACIFRLKSPQVHAKDDTNTDCYNAEKTKNPLCQDPDTGEYGSTQYFAKAYPGTRELAFLKGLGSQAIVASICPATTDQADKDKPVYGYRPAITTLIDRFRTVLNGVCLPRSLAADTDRESPTYGKVSCVVFEASNPKDGDCDCASLRGRRPPVANTLSDDLKNRYSCICELEQLEGEDRTDCQTLSQPRAGGDPDGWCYVDPRMGGSCELVQRCEANKQRRIRFVGEGQPRTGTEAFIQCQEDTATSYNDDTDRCGRNASQNP